MQNKDDAQTKESEVTLLVHDELDAVAGGKEAGGKPTPGKLRALFRQKQFVKSKPRTLICALPALGRRRRAGEFDRSAGFRKTAPAFAGRWDRLVLDAVGRLWHLSLGDHIPAAGDVRF
jgi:hypothetical protein